MNENEKDLIIAQLQAKVDELETEVTILRGELSSQRARVWNLEDQLNMVDGGNWNW